MIYITRRERFSAAHRLFNPKWSDEKNFETFGLCANPNWHGHNYELFVTIKGNINPTTGFLMDLSHLSAIIKSKVIDKLDHKNINLDVDFMKGKMASAEVITIEIFHQLKPEIEQAGVVLHAVKLHETENNFVEYFGA